MKPLDRLLSALGRTRCGLLLGAAAVVAPSLPLVHADASFSLRGFAPGQAMAACPSGWQQYRAEVGFRCLQHGGTLSSRPVQATFLYVRDGRLLSVWIDMKDPGDLAHVQRSLTEKYGPPPVDHGASRAWVSADSKLTVGQAGGILLRKERRDQPAVISAKSEF